jgi:DnaJ homolog subfamily C member 28
MTESEKTNRSPREWESAVEKQIRESMDRGEFKNLTGEGNPQDLTVNPFVPEDRRQAFRILKNAGVAPEWIEQDKEIRTEKN